MLARVELLGFYINSTKEANMENKSFIGLLIIFTSFFIWVISPFYSAILWAVAISIIFFPMKEFLLRKLNSATLATVITLIACCVIVIIPMATVVTLTVNETQEIVDKIKNEEIDPAKYIENIDSSVPAVNNTLDRFGVDVETIKQEVQKSAKTIGSFISKSSLTLGKSTFGFFLNVGVMLYLAFFFLKDGNKIASTIFRALPLGDRHEKLLFEKFKEVTRATVKGNIIVATIQGMVGGITFWLLDIPGAALWMFIMAVASMIPAIGAAIIWGPAAVYFLITGEYIKGAILFFVGVVIISLIDNILRPLLVGRDTKMPDYVIFISTIGGISIFGINGFVIGPIIAAMFFVSWKIFIKEY